MTWGQHDSSSVLPVYDKCQPDPHRHNPPSYPYCYTCTAMPQLIFPTTVIPPLSFPHWDTPTVIPHAHTPTVIPPTAIPPTVIPPQPYSPLSFPHSHTPTVATPLSPPPHIKLTRHTDTTFVHLRYHW
ncbi:uncharacterized protein [Penaeus vannamei]|uniref:uncharacterized protein n=1 Tax=Penaeus vannamei TaxID=6689 RepID=UPI00387F5BA6